VLPVKKPALYTEAKEVFNPTDVVILKSDRSRVGTVQRVQITNGVETVSVFIDKKIRPFDASQLELYIEPEMQTLSADRFRAYLSALAIQHPGAASLYSLNSARVDFIPYQYRPVLRFIRADRPRMLIADSVGVGKTIEAGLILRELQARKEIRSVLIICPRPLVAEKKWFKEMKRFDEDFEHLDGNKLRFCIDQTDLDGEWPWRYAKAIIPYSILNQEEIFEGKGRRKGLNNLDPPPHFDLVIVDEAHHARNMYTNTYNAIKFFCDNAEAAIFLTATPIQLGDNDLLVLLNLLRPDLIIDRSSFNYMAEPNPFINSAVSAMRKQTPDWYKEALGFLNQAEETEYGRQLLSNNPDFIDVKEKLKKTNISREDRVKTITTTENLHTLSGIINRTRRRDIGEFTIRKPYPQEIPFTPAQQTLHDNLLEIQKKIFHRLHGNQNAAFMMTTIRRQAASCIFGLKPFLEEMLTRHADELYAAELMEDAADDTLENDVNTGFISSLDKEIRELLNFAETLDEEDPKFEKLYEIIVEKQKQETHRIMLFSSFRHTLRYLESRLKERAIRTGLIHGGVADEDRLALRERFEMPREDPNALHILLFSEVGCEGLDYQFCDCMVNYDLPWNPMKIDQRIGRIDRNGQKSESVAIFNMLTPGTIDYDIYSRCLERIGVFERAIGDCDEILGEITKDIKSIAENFGLSDEDKRTQFEQKTDNNIRKIQEVQRLEDEEFNFIGLKLPREQMNEEIKDASNFYLNHSSIEHLVRLYLQDKTTKDQEVILGKESLKTLRLSQDSRNQLLDDFNRLIGQNYRKNPTVREWERWLRGSDQHFAITFESDCAKENRKAAFLTPLHTLVRQAAAHFSVHNKIIVKLDVVSNKVSPGDYPFAVYQWNLHGIREDHNIKIITESENISDYIEELLKDARDCSDEDIKGIDDNISNNFDQRHHEIWEIAKKEYALENNRHVQHQRHSLTTSHKARTAVLNDRLKNNNDEKIGRMIQGEMKNAEADYQRRLKSLIDAEEKADIEFTPAAYGVLRVKGGK
jgi:ERCC4-related helicase